MKVDLHIHTKDCSDGRMNLQSIFQTAHDRKIGVMSITDHDSLDCQERAEKLARQYGILYIYGLELNVTFSHPDYRNSKPISLDFLAYDYDIRYDPLVEKLTALRDFRKKRAGQILEKINHELIIEGLSPFDDRDLAAIEVSVDGAFGRPHIANYLVKKGIVSDRQEAFDNYLVKCNVPKLPLSLKEASELVRGANGKLMLAHPNDPNGTSLVSFTSSIEEQHGIIREAMLPYIDGIECWHTRHDRRTTESYLDFAKRNNLLVTGGSDCHQDPILMGGVDVPLYVVRQFGIDLDDIE
jgi:predicted metal-dependent phosphoesterase TrpH